MWLVKIAAILPLWTLWIQQRAELFLVSPLLLQTCDTGFLDSIRSLQYEGAQETSAEQRCLFY